MHVCVLTPALRCLLDNCGSTTARLASDLGYLSHTPPDGNVPAMNQEIVGMLDGAPRYKCPHSPRLLLACCRACWALLLSALLLVLQSIRRQPRSSTTRRRCGLWKLPIHAWACWPVQRCVWQCLWREGGLHIYGHVADTCTVAASSTQQFINQCPTAEHKRLL
jgi:hypothetical protein